MRSTVKEKVLVWAALLVPTIVVALMFVNVLDQKLGV